MKFKSMPLKILMLFSVIFFASCNKDDEQEQPPAAAKTEIKTNLTGKWFIHYATWTEWGHASADCAGWGLCNYSDCWFCEGDDKHSGKVIYNETNQGFLYIELDKSQDIENAAITEKLPFSVDADIDNPNSILKQGHYPFDPTIGKYGGYKLNITIKNN